MGTNFGWLAGWPDLAALAGAAGDPRSVPSDDYEDDCNIPPQSPLDLHVQVMHRGARERPDVREQSTGGHQTSKSTFPVSRLLGQLGHATLMKVTPRITTVNVT